MKRYRFLAEADFEFHEQIAYYDQQAEGLGDEFITAVEVAIRAIREYPESGSSVSRFVRKRVVRTFKYNVLYLNEPDEVVIIAIAPQRRRPNYWRSRLRRLKR